MNMSMVKCSCDKIFDTDFEMNTDERGECCCDSCYREMFDEFRDAVTRALEASFDLFDGVDMDNLIENLMDEGFRKVK